jgi:hypothetical protein
MRFVIECDNMSFVEKEFKKFLKSINLLKNLEIKESNLTELFTIKEKQNIDYIIHNLIKLIDENPLPMVKNLQDKIKQKDNEIENLKKALNIQKEITNKLEEKCIELKKYSIKESIIINEDTKIKEPVIIEKQLKEEPLIIEEEPIKEKPKKNIQKYINGKIFCDKFIEKGDNKFLVQTGLLYQIYKENTLGRPLSSITFIRYIKKEYNIENKMIRYEDGQKLQTWIGIRLIKCPDKVFSDNKEIDDFVKKYMEFGIDSPKNKWRCKSEEVFKLFLEKYRKPMEKKIFNLYITQKYNIIRKDVIDFYRRMIPMWIGVILINITPIKSKPLDFYVKNFIDEHCIIDDKSSVISNDLNLSLKNYCIKNNYMPERTENNCWCDTLCKNALNKIGIIFENNGSNIEQKKYKGITLKSPKGYFVAASLACL